MARPLVADRVKETTLTTGTGQITLAGAATGFVSFEQSFASGASVYYLIVDNPDSTTQYELGIGTFTQGTPNKLSRDKVLLSSNSGSLVDFIAGGTVVCPYSGYFLRGLIDSIDSDLVTAGTSTALTLVSYRPDATLYEGRFVCFKLHTTCGASPTLNVDGLGAKGLVDINGTAIASGALIGGAYYWCKYDATSAKWVVFSPFGYLSAAAANITGTFALSGEISPTALSTDQNDYAPTSLSTASVIRQDLSASVNITGLTGGASGRILVLRNISSAYNMTLKDASASSTAANRFKFGRDVVVGPLQTAVIRYDGTNSRWAEVSLPESSPVPTGAVFWFAAVSTPAGYLECNGATVSRTTYAALFAIIGTTFGTGDGSTTFNLPDLRAEFIRGWDHGRGVDTGRTFGSSQADELKSHTHPVSFIRSNAGGGSYAEDADSSGSTSNNSTDATGGTETRPRNVALLPCIKI